MTNIDVRGRYQTQEKVFRLRELSEYLACELRGDPELVITGVSTLERATSSEISFLSNPKYTRQVDASEAAAVITSDPSVIPQEKAALVSANPYLAFARALELFTCPPPLRPGIHPTALVSPTAKLGTGVSVGPFTFIGEGVRVGNDVIIRSHCSIHNNVDIGDKCLIHSHCVIREDCRLGCEVILQNGAVIGSDGFGYARRDDRSWHKIPQTGVVIIEDQVEIGAGAVIDRATIGETRIRRGAKIDNLVQVGHGSVVGEDTLLCAQVGLAGSTTVGNEVILGGQVGAAGHLTIGDRVIATAQTGIPGSVPPDSVISGYPAIPNRDWLKASAIFAQLPRLYREINSLKRRLAALETAAPSTAEGVHSSDDGKN
ncbi:MAG TPA: UDP-3-O-(3-hydroxymyristoyl)glucosamine N-acyltransferase [Blastocatellia bacterium]|nr:UDP-3-O-(3-hydroxymyristoyl)glucosamine N-acyltransferase [Blastocatellia bacterium]